MSAAGRRGLSRELTAVLLPALSAVWLLMVLSTDPAVAGRDLLVRVGGDLAVTTAWLVAAVGWGLAALRLAGVRPRGDQAVLQLATAAALGLGVMSAAVLCLGLAGWMNRWSGVGLLAGGLAIAVTRWIETRPAVRSYLRGSAGSAAAVLLAAPILGTAVLGAFILPGILHQDEPAGYDVVAYHLQLPREWFEIGRIAPLWHNTFSLHPLGVEMHYLLAMHLRGGPWAGMYVAQLMHGVYFLLTAAAVYGVARSWGRTRATLAALLVATVPWTLLLANVAYNEGALWLYGVLSVWWLVRGFCDPPPEPGAPMPVGVEHDTAPRSRGGRSGGLSSYLVAGACAGFAMSVKYTAAVLAGLVPLVALALVAAGCRLAGLLRGGSEQSFAQEGGVPDRPPRRRAAVLGIVMFGIAASICVAPWLVRNLAWAGNPVFPLLADRLGAAGWDAGQIERFVVAHQPRVDQRSVAGAVEAASRQIVNQWRYGAPTSEGSGTDWWQASPLVVIGCVSAVVALAGPRRVPAAMLGLCVALSLGAWLGLTHWQGRFFTPAIPLLALLVVMPSVRVWSAVVVAVCVAQVWSLAEPIRRVLNPQLRPAIAVVDPLPLVESGLPDRVVREALHGGRTLVLVGDARAFWYSIPMSRLRYRHVFDVPSEGDWLFAWAGRSPPDAIVVADPGELRRFARTYRNLPPVPSAVLEATGPAVVR